MFPRSFSLPAGLKQLAREFRGVIGEGFERSVLWVHSIAVFGAFATDFLKPFLGRFTLVMLVIAAGAMGVVWWSIQTGKIRGKQARKRASAAFVFTSIVAFLSLLLFGLQQLEGDPPEGGLAHVNATVAGLQSTLESLLKSQKTIIEGQTALSRKLDALSAQVSRAKGVPPEALQAILARFGAAVATQDPDQIRDVLERKADEYLALKSELANLSADDPRARDLQHQAELAFARNDFDGAQKLLHRAADIDRTAYSELAARAEARARAAANSFERAADVANVAVQYRDAASDLAVAATLLAPYDKHAIWRLTFKQAQMLERRAEEFGDDDAYADSIATYRVAQTLAQNPLDLSRTQNNLGNVTWALGLREKGTALLDDALSEYKEAIKASPRETNPVMWAGRENNIAAVTVEIGNRKNDPSHFDTAADDFRDIAAIYAKARQPQDWAMAENNLTEALVKAAEYRNDTRQLPEAIAACKAALTVYTQSQDPLDWAMVQNNLATVYDDLGKINNDPQSIAMAIGIYEQALQAYTRERDPPDWAMTEDNLGEALEDLGLRKIGTGELQSALQAVNASLEEFSEAHTPLAWGRAECDRGDILFELGRRRGDSASLKEAIAAYSLSLREITAESSPTLLSLLKAHLVRAQALLKAQTAKKP